MTTQRDPQDEADPGVESEIRKLTKAEGEALDRGRLSDKVKKILGDADARDAQANTRDEVADERSRVADRDSFINTDEVYAGHGERRAAALDRSESKTDRESSADDRIRLTQEEADSQAQTTTEIRALKQKVTGLEKGRENAIPAE